MPNWCSTQYAIQGPKDQVSALFDTMTELENMEQPLCENGYGTTWLGCLVKKLGGDPNRVGCRGEWNNLRRKEGDDTVIFFNTETAWSKCDDVENLITSVYPELEIIFLEEELGCDIFDTNDIAGTFFPENIIIDLEDDGYEYYTMEDALQHLSEITGESINNWDKAVAICDKLNAAQDENEGEGHIWLHKAEYV